jgi:DNA-directed RNA polymerase subunit RPC12/RpoP
MTAPAREITCVDCGGRAHLISYAPEDGQWVAGDVVAYRCADCNDRWDVVLEEEDLAD